MSRRRTKHKHNWKISQKMREVEVNTNKDWDRFTSRQSSTTFTDLCAAVAGAGDTNAAGVRRADRIVRKLTLFIVACN